MRAALVRCTSESWTTSLGPRSSLCPTTPSARMDRRGGLVATCSCCPVPSRLGSGIPRSRAAVTCEKTPSSGDKRLAQGHLGGLQNHWQSHAAEGTREVGSAQPFGVDARLDGGSHGKGAPVEGIGKWSRMHEDRLAQVARGRSRHAQSVALSPNSSCGGREVPRTVARPAENQTGTDTSRRDSGRRSGETTPDRRCAQARPPRAPRTWRGRG